LKKSEQIRIYDSLETGVLNGAKRLSPGKKVAFKPRARVNDFSYSLGRDKIVIFEF